MPRKAPRTPRTIRRRRRAGSAPRFAILVGVAIVLVVALAALRPNRLATPQNTGIRIGAVAPILHLEATTGHEVSLASFRGYPVLVFFYEGATCGACQEQLVELQNDLPEISALGVKVVAVSTDPLAVSISLAQQLQLGFPILSDTAGGFGSSFGVFNLSGGMNMGPVDRHSFFIIGPHGHVRWKRLSLNAMHVPMSDVLAALKVVAKP